VKGITLFPCESIQASVFAGLLFDREVASETMNKETQPAPDRIDQEILAADALERARLLPPGPERNEALKLASLLRCTVDSRGPVFAKRGRPRK
jgi:hypothetical protein